LVLLFEILFITLFRVDDWALMHFNFFNLLLQAPIFTMYAAGAGLIPVPFRRSIESALGRPAITLLDIDKVVTRASPDVTFACGCV